MPTNVKLRIEGAQSYRIFVGGTAGTRQLASGFVREQNFELFDSDPTMRLIVRVEGPPWASTPQANLLLIVQDFALTRGPRGTLVEPTHWGGSYASVNRSKLHPRLRSRGNVSSGGGTTAAFDVDLSFIDVTEFFGRSVMSYTCRTHPTVIHSQPGQCPICQQDLVPKPVGLGGLDVTRPMSTRPPNLEIRAYEDTSSPSGSNVVIVACSRDQVGANTSLYHSVVFIRPSGDGGYADPQHARTAALERYLLSTDPGAPFFLRTFTQNPAEMDNPHDCSKWFSDVTPCGFLDQMRQVAKPLVLLMPMGHGGRLCNSAIRTAALSLRRALYGDEVVGTAVTEMAPEGTMRLALAGFSLGANVSQSVFNSARASIDEYYWFDPPRATAAAASAGDFATWLGGTASDGQPRRLRLTAGLEHVTFLTLARDIRASLSSRTPPAPADLVRSLIPANFWQNSPTYQHAVAVPICTPRHQGEFPETMDPIGTGTPTTRFTRDVGLEGRVAPTQPAAVAGHVDMRLRLAAHGKNETPDEINCTLHELVGFVRFQFRNYHYGEAKPPRPLAEADFSREEGPSVATLLREINTHIRSHEGIRHQWSVVGGEYVGGSTPVQPTRSAPFVGYLQMCLSEGLF